MILSQFFGFQISNLIAKNTQVGLINHIYLSF